MSSSFEKRYPNIAYWVRSHGWIELRRDHYRPSLARALLDEGGMVWEGSAHYETVDEAFDALESALAEWMEQNV